MLKVFVFLIGLGLGLLLIVKTDGVERVTGPIGWAERTFGGAGTNSFYKLLGLLLIIIGTAYATGLVDRILGGFIRGIFGQG